MTWLPFATAVLTAIGFALICLMIIASGRVFECIREIAMNTRAMASEDAERKARGLSLAPDQSVLGILCLVVAGGIVLLSLK